MMVTHIFFLIFAAVALLFAGIMLTRKSALDGAICLIVCFLSFAGLYAMLDAPFVAIMQVLVYAGAIMMLIIFVIMTVDTQEKRHTIQKPVIIGSIIATVIMATSLLLFFTALRSMPNSHMTGNFLPGTVERIGKLLFANHVLNFEMISLLLLTALVGALVLGKKQNPLKKENL